MIFVESGGDNLAATFSPELSDLTIYVIDVAAARKFPTKGGPGIMKSDLLVINKIDLAPYVGASLEVMDHDAKKMRGKKPFVFSEPENGQGRRRNRRLHQTPGHAGLVRAARASLPHQAHGFQLSGEMAYVMGWRLIFPECRLMAFCGYEPCSEVVS